MTIAGESVSPFSTALPHVLIVDDEPGILTSVADLIEDRFEIHLASSGQEALGILQDKPIAVLLSDQRMPGMSGDELLSAAASLSQATRILLTGYADLEGVIRAVNRGHIYAYVTKPWDPSELLLTVARAAEHHDLVQSLNHERMLLAQLMENVPDAIFFKDAQQHFTRVNRAKARLVGLDHPEQLIGRGDWDFFPSHESARIQAEDVSVISGRRSVVDRVEIYTPPDGRERWLSTTKVSLDGGQGLVGISRDITERKRSEQQLEAMTSALLAAEKEKESFGRQIVTAVTGGKFHLVDAHEIPPLVRLDSSFDLTSQLGHRQMREKIRQLGAQVDWSSEATEDMVLAAGEAATNTVKHARDGSCQLGIVGTDLVVRISDQGPGIGRAELPQSLFRPGYSSKVSLGLGYTVILEIVDEVWLATGPTGTVLQLVKRGPHEDESDQELEALLDRFG